MYLINQDGSGVWMNLNRQLQNGFIGRVRITPNVSKTILNNYIPQFPYIKYGMVRLHPKKTIKPTPFFTERTTSRQNLSKNSETKKFYHHTAAPTEAVPPGGEARRMHRNF